MAKKALKKSTSIGLLDAISRARQLKQDELNKLTFKSTANTIEERITKVIHAKHPAYEHADEFAELVQVRQTYLLGLLVDHLLSNDMISDAELDHLLLRTAKETI